MYEWGNNINKCDHKYAKRNMQRISTLYVANKCPFKAQKHN